MGELVWEQMFVNVYPVSMVTVATSQVYCIPYLIQIEYKQHFYFEKILSSLFLIKQLRRWYTSILASLKSFSI